MADATPFSGLSRPFLDLSCLILKDLHGPIDPNNSDMIEKNQLKIA